ncbi:hypothetical protein RBB50_007536 [Rhinocladiella similis]
MSDATIEGVAGGSKRRRSVGILLDSDSWSRDLPRSQDASSPPLDLHPSRRTAQLRPPVNRPATPVPSLTFSQDSTCSHSSQEDGSPTTSIKSSSQDPATRSSGVHSPCPVKTTTIGLGDNEMVDPFYTPPQTRGNRNAALVYHDFPPFEASYVNPWTGGYAGAIAPRTQPRKLATGVQEISYIEWDDEENEHTRRIPTALARIRKSLADLRTADRFNSNTSTSRKASTKTQDSVSDDITSIPQPTTAGGSPNHVKSCSPTKITPAARYKESRSLGKSLPPLPLEQFTSNSTETTGQCSLGRRRSAELVTKKCSCSLPSSLIAVKGHRRTIDSDLEIPGPSSPVALQHTFAPYSQTPRSASVPILGERDSSDSLYWRTDRSDKMASITLVEKWLSSPLRVRRER